MSFFSGVLIQVVDHFCNFSRRRNFCCTGQTGLPIGRLFREIGPCNFDFRFQHHQLSAEFRTRPWEGIKESLPVLPYVVMKYIWNLCIAWGTNPQRICLSWWSLHLWQSWPWYQGEWLMSFNLKAALVGRKKSERPTNRWSISVYDGFWIWYCLWMWGCNFIFLGTCIGNSFSRVEVSPKVLAARWQKTGYIIFPPPDFRLGENVIMFLNSHKVTYCYILSSYSKTQRTWRLQD